MKKVILVFIIILLIPCPVFAETEEEIMQQVEKAYFRDWYTVPIVVRSCIFVQQKA